MTLRFVSKTSGFMIIEALVAAGIIGISILGLGVGLTKLAHSRDSTIGVSTALAFESSMQWVLQDPTSYTNPLNSENVSQALSTIPYKFPNLVVFDVPFTKPDGTPITVQLKISDYHSSPITNYYREDGTAGSSSDWTFKVTGAGKNLRPPGPPTNTFGFGIAYRIEFNPDRANIGGLGAESTAFANTDYKWIIPPEVYYNKLASKSCDTSAGDVIVTGVNPETGDVTCLGIGNTPPCQSNEIAIGWEFDANPSPHLKLKCQSWNPTRACPQLAPNYEYVANSIQPPHAADPYLPIHCVFRAQSRKVVTASSGLTIHSATFEICPPHYIFNPTGADSGCSFALKATVKGWQDIGCPAGSGVNWVQNIDPTPMSITGVITAIGAKKDREVTCTLVDDKQIIGPATDNNWAGYYGVISVDGTCVLEDTDTKDL